MPLDGTAVERFGGSSTRGIGVGEMSPDLQSVAADSHCSAPVDCIPGLVQIDLASGEISQLTTQDSDADAQWSPDGSRIAFTRMNNVGRGVWVMNADGSNLTRLTTPDRPLRDHDIAWSPDGGSILFTRGQITDAGHLGDVYTVPARGGEPKILISDSIADW